MKGIEAALIGAVFVFQITFFQSISPPEVFNMFVENSVQKRQSNCVSDSPRDASTDCTGVSAGTFVVDLPTETS
jgi:hypothetical protein